MNFRFCISFNFLSENYETTLTLEMRAEHDMEPVDVSSSQLNADSNLMFTGPATLH